MSLYDRDDPERRKTKPRYWSCQGTWHPKKTVSQAVSEGSLFDRLIERREVKDGKITAGVFIPLPAKLAKQFPNKDEHDDSKPHITVLYIGDITKDQQAKLAYGVKKVAAHIAPFKMTLDTYNEFQNAEGQTIPSMTGHADHPHGLGALHVALWRAAEDAGLPVGHSYGDYVPGKADAAAFKTHATLDYLEPGKGYSGPRPTGSWDVNELEVWGHQVDKIPLGSALTEAKLPPMKFWGISKNLRRDLLDVALGRTIKPALMKELEAMGVVQQGKLTPSGHRTLREEREARSGGVHKESSDFPQRYASPTAPSARTGLGSAPVADPRHALEIAQRVKQKVKREWR